MISSSLLYFSISYFPKVWVPVLVQHKNEISDFKPTAVKSTNLMGLLANGLAFGIFAILATLTYLNLSQILMNPPVDPNAKSIFEFSVPKSDAPDDIVSLAEYRGKKAYLVVNVACKCGLTDKNYAELQTIYDKYR
jgi:hypothetical protein